MSREPERKDFTIGLRGGDWYAFLQHAARQGFAHDQEQGIARK